MKVITLIALLSALSATAYAKAGMKGLITYYNCKGQSNGNYNHPSDCTKFITCSNGYAYEMNCADCNTSEGPQRCPEGKLHYYKPLDRCEWANVAQCSSSSTTEDPSTTSNTDDPSSSSSEYPSTITTSKTDSPTSTTKTTPTETETPTTSAEPPTTVESTTPSKTNQTTPRPTEVSTAATTSGPPAEETTTEQSSGDTCNPKDCKLEGHCTAFRKCNKLTSRWENLTCADGLFWNPDWNANEIGGSCDNWDNLSATVKDQYEQHDMCFPDCYFREDEECSSNYIFHPAGTDHRTEEALFCPPGLIWNQGHETCDFCQNVLKNSTVSQTEYCSC